VSIAAMSKRRHALPHSSSRYFLVTARSSMMRNGMILSTIDPLIATGVVLATAATDAVYVMSRRP
jgi:hypothetical protein